MFLAHSFLIVFLMLDCAHTFQVITNCFDLQNTQNNLAGNYILGNDIDCSSTATWNGGTGFMPITPFTGTFNGGNYTIYNLTINLPSTPYVGLFGYVNGVSAQIMNIHLIGVNITGNLVGGLAGYNTGTIANSTISGSVSGSDYVGGLVGYNAAIITRSYATCSVSGTGYVGGLVGENDGAISSSYATGSVSGPDYVGGLVGYNYQYSGGGGPMRNPEAYGTITSSYATGSVSGSGYIGGLVAGNIGTISNTYATGSVSGSGYGGGLVGQNFGIISNTYATGNVSASGGGLVAENFGDAYSSYWDIETTGQAVSATGVGENTLALYHNATYLGWNFNCVWSIDEGNAMPQLTLNSCPSTQRQVSNCVELQAAVFSYTAEITLTQDIDCTETATWNNGAGFYPGLLHIGTFDGLGHRIINLTINSLSQSPIGLFGKTSNGVQISNIILEGSIILGNTNVGSLAGINSGAIINSYATGNVSGLNYVGGLVGTNSGTITDSYTTGSVSGSYYVGGLVGTNDGTIANSYASGNVSGSANIGGLVGVQIGAIIQSYATGSVSGLDFVGGLLGFQGGSITLTYATGSVFGSNDVGGLVGYNIYGTITNSFASGNVSGSTNIGGLVGENDGTITNSYAVSYVTGNPLGSTNTGGFVGYNSGTGSVTNSYSIGNVSGSTNVGGLAGSNSGTVTSAYWDTQTSAQMASAAGLGLSGPAMKQAVSFIGWDFTNIWVMYTGVTYPLLQGFIIPPVLSNSLNNVTQYIGSLLEFTVPSNIFTEPNGLQLTYRAKLMGGYPLPAWLIFNPYTQTFAGLPLSGAQGVLMIEVSVYNIPSLSVSDLWQLTIPDRPPTLNASFAQQVALNGQPFQFIVPSLTFVDPDADPLQLSATLQNTTSLPAWLSFNAALGIFSGTATHRGNQWINVTANDGFGGLVSTLLEIITPNSAPATTATFPNQPAVIAQPLSFTIPTQLFFDLDGDPLSYTATLFGGAKLPSWLSFNAQTLAFQGTPSAVGFLMVSVTAMDPYNATTSLNFGVSVSASSSNTPPLLAIQILDQAATVGQPFELALPKNMFVDPEGNPLTYRATLEGGAPLPSWLNFNTSSLLFLGVPPNTGSWPIAVRADDGLGGFAFDTFTLTSNQNLPPLLQNPISNQVVAVGENYQFIIPSNTFIQVNNAPLSYAAMTLPNGPLPRWLHFNPNTRTFAGTPSDTDTNVYAPRISMIEVRASNGIGSAITTFQLSVTGTSQAAKIINALITLASIASTAFAAYRNRAFLWNTLLKKKYEKETKHIALNKPFSYQFTVPSEKIIRVKALNKASSKQIRKKYWECLNSFSFNAYQKLPYDNYLPSWLQFNRDTMTLSGTATEPDDFYICAEGFDGRYLEAFKLRCGISHKKDQEMQQI